MPSNNITNNPYAVYSLFVSEQRNMFLSSSIAIAMIGFSNTIGDKKMKMTLKMLCVIIFILSMWFGISSSRELNYYLDNNDSELPSYIPIHMWKSALNINYIYTTIIFVIAIMFTMNKIIYE